MTAMNSKPPSSAVRATVARSAPSRGGPSGVVKSGICKPIFTVYTLSRCPVALVQGRQRPQERVTVTGRQGAEDLFLAGADRGLHRLAQPVAGRGEREQVHPPVRGVGLPPDQPALLQVVKDADDAALVRVDG